MIVYLDSSALVKRYIAEAGSAEVGELIGDARATGTVVASRVEVAATLAKAMRTRTLSRETATRALAAFNEDWVRLARLPLNEPLAASAALLAWEHSLRGYDAVQLAAALSWRESLGAAVIMATYDRELWRAARTAGLSPWPARIP